MAAYGAQDPVEALTTGLASATGSVYAVDVREPGGLDKLAHVVDLIFVRRIVAPDVRDALSVHTPAALTILLSDPAGAHSKLVAQCFASVYPRIFSYVCYDQSPAALQIWQMCSALREHVVTLLDAPQAGARIGAAKACQRIIQVQSQPDGDPRAHSRNEVNLRMVPADHPFVNANELAAEAGRIFSHLVSLIYTTALPDLVMVVVNVLARLASASAALRSVVIEALASWTPASLAGSAPVHIRSAETTVKLALVHFLRHGVSEAHAAKIDDALDVQRRRMDAARKRPRDSAQDAPSKRHAPASVTAAAAAALAPPGPPPAPSSFTAEDVGRIPVSQVVDLIISSLQAVSVEQLEAAVAAHARDMQPQAAPAGADAEAEAPEPAKPAVPVDPLKMDVGDDELPPAAPQEAQPAAAEPAAEAPLVSLEHFRLPPPTPLADAEAQALIAESIVRICRTGADSRDIPGTTDLWIMLVTRLATRGLDTSTVPGGGEPPAAMLAQATRVRELLFQYVSQDFCRRRRIAQQWLAEEWACDRQRAKAGHGGRYYREWLDKLVASLIDDANIREHALGPFLAELPELPESVVDSVQRLCLERDSLAHGFVLLRDIGASRPPLRMGVCERVLELTRHRDRLVRGKAIVTARSWMLQKGPLADRVLAFAHESLKLVVAAARREWQREIGGLEGTVVAEGGQEADVADDDAEDAAEEQFDDQDVLRLMELALVLSVKQPTFVESIVSIYPQLTPGIQGAMEKHIAPLARALGPNNTVLLDVLRHAPRGADALVLEMLRILTEKAHTRALGLLIRDLVDERGVDAHYLLPVLPELEKDDVLRMLPRIVGLLGTGNADDKQAVQTLLQALVVPAVEPETGMPATPVLTAAELLVRLHTGEQISGLKPAAAAVQMCFALPNIFRSDVLSAALSVLVEQDPVPVLFMRTAIMAVKAHHTLSSYVSTTLLHRLVEKRVWEEPRLWDGFALCVSITSPESFGTLLDLPPAQMEDVLKKQAGIRAPLREYLIHKAGGNSRHAWLLRLLDSQSS
ncbi:hypothetical protein MCUN1_002350 [Malassezia cuniculi]|uniref:Symplekin n=1 Tax=Malassezia cuniculi TaxID=948313 RepID=A0AAF0EVU5_9BASI|nr:hypothetical protein MCUN1_002350 [Malassezia cuniculi]